jgi:hypothetical protein
MIRAVNKGWACVLHSKLALRRGEVLAGNTSDVKKVYFPNSGITRTA